MDYRVLARKYRPTNFDDLVGQEVLVHTLGNAFKTGRIAHAFLLTGIRGIGKTTTARIIARGLNCIGAEGTQTEPTVSPCGVCSHCVMIGEDRHPDVMEMDAASRTGVGDIRELIEMVRYLPSSARMKVYIIDEVHMLSNSAFNALLKTLEEPPPHVKFIFATTEARKIPVTILSRCQRFDLKRLDTEGLARHLGTIAGKEGVNIAPLALNLLALAAEGSVRDGLSLLDQAIAHHSNLAAEITALDTRNLLGMVERTSVLALLDALFKGEVNDCLQQFSGMYAQGADPITVLSDCLEMLHFTTRIHLNKDAGSDANFSQAERQLAEHLAATLSMPALTRAWQMLLKGVQEARMAPSAKAAVEMVLVRVAYASHLPTPEEALKKLAEQPEAARGGSAPRPQLLAATPASDIPSQAALPPAAAPQTMEEVVALLDVRREALIASQLREYASLVSLKPGLLEIFLLQPMGREFAGKLAMILHQATGMEWKIAIATHKGAPTIAEQQASLQASRAEAIINTPIVSDVLSHFPGAEVVS